MSSLPRLAWSLVLVSACAADSGDPCADAAAKLAVCFPAQAAIAPTCDADTADVIAASSCDELSARDGKADSWTCTWMPWLCASGGGSGGTSSGRTIEVSVLECGGGPDALCPYVQSAACGLVTLHDDGGDEIARGYSSGGGRFTFAGVPAGDYTVKVRKRDGALAKMMASEYSSATESAVLPISVDGGEAPWARFNLIGGSAALITQCANLEGGLTVTDGSGTEVDRHDVEWEWLVELEAEGEVIERTRPLFIYDETSPTNVLGFDLLRPGTYTVRFVRMNIPSYKRLPNPDYAALRRYYSATSVEPIETTVTITSAQRGKTLPFARTIVDPLR